MRILLLLDSVASGWMNWLPRFILAAAAGWLAGAILVTEFRINDQAHRTAAGGEGGSQRKDSK